MFKTLFPEWLVQGMRYFVPLGTHTFDKIIIAIGFL